MATKIKWSESKIKMLQEEGRGKGVGPDYKPWVQITDFSSLGNSRRAFSRKTGRIHHFLSDVEWHLFLLLEFSPMVVDIREQYPLQREETLSIAAQRSIKHPIYPGTNVAAVMTCDFLVKTNESGHESLKAFSCKRTEAASDIRAIEKLEIERTFFDSLGAPHHLVFHSELPKNKIHNLGWCRNATLNDNGVEEYQTDMIELSKRFVNELQRASTSCSLAEHCSNFDARVGAAQGMGLRIARALLWQGELTTDMHQRDLAATPIAMFRTTHQSGGLRLIRG